MQGKFVEFVSGRRYGFIKPSDGSPNVFCHVREIKKAGIPPQTVLGKLVMFDLMPNVTSASAIHLRLVEPTQWRDGIGQLPIYAHWHATFRQRVLAARSFKQFQREAVLATLEAVVRTARKRGWTVRHTSEYKHRVSSRYIVVKHIGVCRISNHPVVTKGKPYWNGEVLITENDWRTVDAETMMRTIVAQAARR